MRDFKNHVSEKTKTRITFIFLVLVLLFGGIADQTYVWFCKLNGEQVQNGH